MKKKIEKEIPYPTDEMLNNRTKRPDYVKMSSSEFRRLRLLYPLSGLSGNSTILDMSQWLNANSKKLYCPACFIFRLSMYEDMHPNWVENIITDDITEKK